MKYSGIRFFRIGGTEIIIDYSCFVFFGLTAYTAAETYFPQSHRNYTSSQCWLMGLIVVLLLFASILFHECAHLLVALKQGIRISSIRVLVFGGLQQVSSEPGSGRHDFLMALAGPAASMAVGLFSLIFYCFLSLSKTESPLMDFTAWLSFVNIGLLSIHNLIPGFPLDGGRILRAFLWDRWDDMSRATRVVSQIGSGFGLVLIALGVLLLISSRVVVAGLWFIFVGFFMKQSAVGIYHSVMLRHALSGVQVRQVMTEKIVTVDWLTSVEELVRDYIYRHQFTNFPVLNRDEFVGMVSLDGVKTISKDLWGFKQVRDIMTPIESVPCLAPADDTSDALSRMVSSDIGCMPVVEDGKLRGIVSRRDIMNLFKIKSDLGTA